MDAMTLPADHVTVLGGGIVGTSTALYLRLAGRPVTLIDMGEPGAGCSSGNAGMLGVDSCVPSGLPGTVARIPAMLRSADGPLGIDPRIVPAALPWFLRFASATRPDRVERIAKALNNLQRHLMPAYAVLLETANAGNLVVNAGKLHVSESKDTFAATAPARAIQVSNGVDMTILNGDQTRELCPALSPRIVRAAYFPNASHSIDPGEMVARFARAFVRLGGTVVRDRIVDFEAGPDGPTVLVGTTSRHPVEQLVLSAGMGSSAFARRLGSTVPMLAHRGYNVPLAPLEGLTMPVKSEDRKIVVTPMADCTRVTGIAEIAAPERPARPALASRIAAHAQALLPQSRSTDGPTWVGSRPCTPDSLPVIGRSPTFRNVIFAYGHGHLGLGLGAITGRLVSDLIVGRPIDIDLAPYRPDRTGKG